MSYTPTTWNTGDTISASALNKIENGIAGAGSAMIVTDNNDSLDKTFAEIYDALKSGTPVYLKCTDETDGYSYDYTCTMRLMPIVSAYKYDTTYRIVAVGPSYGPNSVSSFSYVFSTTAWMYSATTPTSTPTYYVRIKPSNIAQD